MKNYIYVQIFAMLIFSIFNIAMSQELTQPSPLEPGKIIHPVKIGLYAGNNLPLSPSELSGKPTTATQNVQQSLSNGLNGLGFGSTISMGVIAKYPLSEKFLLGANIGYSGWKSENSCNCSDKIGTSTNSLTFLQFGALAQYFLFDKFYATVELNMNMFGVKATENSNRGNLDFSKSYNRVGAGIGFGYELPVWYKFAFDFSVKGQLPNLLLGQENTGSSESLINSAGNTKEAMIFIISFNIGLLFSL